MDLGLTPQCQGVEKALQNSDKAGAEITMLTGQLQQKVKGGFLKSQENDRGIKSMKKKTMGTFLILSIDGRRVHSESTSTIIQILHKDPVWRTGSPF